MNPSLLQSQWTRRCTWIWKVHPCPHIGFLALICTAWPARLSAGCPLAERSDGAPCCCVSYVTADAADPVSTGVVASTDCPAWDHQHECRSGHGWVELEYLESTETLSGWCCFTGFQTSYCLIHSNHSCSKSGTKEACNTLELHNIDSDWLETVCITCFCWFCFLRLREGAWICFCRPVPLTVWLPISMWLVQHYRLQWPVSRPAKSVHHSTKGGPQPQGTEENCERRSQNLIGERTSC